MAGLNIMGNTVAKLSDEAASTVDPTEQNVMSSSSRLWSRKS
jgi:hypothetical protein